MNATRHGYGRLLTASIAVAVVAVLALTLVPAEDSDGALAASGSLGGDVTYTYDSETCTAVIDGSGDMTNYSQGKSPFTGSAVVHVEFAEGNTITSIGNYLLFQCHSLETVDLSNCSHVTYIGDWAFRESELLRSIDLSACTSLTTMGNSVFNQCTSLESINFENCSNLTSVGNHLIRECKSLVSIDMSPCTSLTVVGNRMFWEDTALKEVILPPNLTATGNYMFYGCSGLETLDLSSYVYLVDLGIEDFSGCTSLTSITLPPNLLYIEDSAFLGCTSLIHVDLPSTIIDLGENTFYGCSALDSIDMSVCTQLSIVGENTFYGCSSLDYAEFPASLTSIGASAFYGCSALKEIVFFGDAPEIGEAAFELTRATADVYTPGWGSDDVFTSEIRVNTVLNYHPLTITVTWEVEGEVVAQESKMWDVDFAFVMPSADRDGYILVGWSEDPDSDTAEYAVGDGYHIMDDTTLYAVWVHEVVLDFDANGGTGGPDRMTQGSSTGSAFFVVPDEVPERADHYFLGWSFDPDATVSELVEGEEVHVEWGATLYAVWAEVPYYDTTLDYDLNGGRNGPTHDTHRDTEPEDQTFLVSEHEPVRDGYAFAGWATSPDATSAEYRGGDEITVPGGERVTLYAVWNAVYTTSVSYDANGGEGAPSGSSVSSTDGGDRTFTVPSRTPARVGYLFSGWATSPDGSARYQPGDSVTVAGGSAVTLYAVWAQEYTSSVIYDANGGDESPFTEHHTGTSTAERTYTIPSTVPVRDERSFVGWATSPDAAVAEYQPGDTVVLAHDESLTLYAVWSWEISVIYDANGGEGAPDDQSFYTTGDEAVAVIADGEPALEGYEFLGWSTSKDATAAEYSAGDELSIAHDTYLYAVWAEAGTAVHGYQGDWVDVFVYVVVILAVIFVILGIVGYYFPRE